MEKTKYTQISYYYLSSNEIGANYQGTFKEGIEFHEGGPWLILSKLMLPWFMQENLSIET